MELQLSELWGLRTQWDHRDYGLSGATNLNGSYSSLLLEQAHHSHFAKLIANARGHQKRKRTAHSDSTSHSESRATSGGREIMEGGEPSGQLDASGDPVTLVISDEDYNMRYNIICVVGIIVID